MSAARILQVAINAPLSRLFDYLPPESGDPQPGCRVRVPFGRRGSIGLVMGLADKSDVPAAKLKRADALLDAEPLLDDTDLWLIRFASDYYHHPIGEVAAAALPTLLRQGKPLIVTTTCLDITDDGRAVDVATLAKRAPRQAELLELVREHGILAADTLDEKMPAWRRVRKALLENGLLVESERVLEEDASSADAADVFKGPPLNTDQADALKAIRAGSGFRVTVLDGVTGSGKTEIYLHLIHDELQAGRQVLVLVPEIGLTPQLLRRFRERLGVEPQLMHSGLTDTARLASWRHARDGNARLIIGTRSAVYLPLANPGLIIVDEEHDASLKQQEGLRYSARDLAIARAKKAGVPIVLGTATPSTESLKRCRDGAYLHLRLPARAGKAVPPLLRLVDLTRHDAEGGLSLPALKAIEKTVQQGAQTLIFLNRRGFAPTLICSSCGNMAECTRCDSRMTVHAGDGRLRCHHCGAERPIDENCGECGSACRPLGQGTERLEDLLRTAFPGELISRIDSDSTRLKGTMTKALASARSGETRILVGTQMLSKGHHFPNLTLVVVVNADQGLFSTDFRGSERLAQTLVQVAGRAGREVRQGEVLIQTAFPQHPFWNELLAGGYEKVAASTLAEREAAAWPPFSRLALIRASATKRADAHRFLQAARRIAEPIAADVRILGPVSAPMERRAGRYRAQLLLQSRERGGLHELLRRLRPALEESREARRVRWTVDVDPIELF